MKTLCFRQTRNMYDSGFRYIEYGYWSDDDGEEKVEVVGRYDILQTDYFNPLHFTIDLTKSGWFRILSRTDDADVSWRYGGEIKITRNAKDSI